MAFEEINKPTNIDRVTDLIDLDVEAGQEVEIDAPVPENGDVEVNFAQDGGLGGSESSSPSIGEY